jgi:hypothetical protein
MEKKRFPWWILLVVPLWPLYITMIILWAIGEVVSKVWGAIAEWRGEDW